MILRKYAENILDRAEIPWYHADMYIHELKDWPHFSWNYEKIASLLLHVRHQQGCLIGRMEFIGFRAKEYVVLQNLTQDVVKSSEIEGEILDQSMVRSSIARRLGIDAAANPVDRNVEGVVEMMLDASQNYHLPLTKERLFGWHAILFPEGNNGLTKIRVGSWRTNSVQVVSGRFDRETIHFEGPSPLRVDYEMDLFLDWINHETKIDLVIKAALAHLWFVTIHPFDDGNGRISRAIADFLLARSENSSNRFYSLSAQIQTERKSYYQVLEHTQKDGLDVTLWMEWFLGCLERAISRSLSTFDSVKHKEQMWKSLSEVSLNERQRRVINRILDDFEGNLTSSKWAKICNCSQDTAYRDILNLIDRGILEKDPGGGRNTSYSLVRK